MIWHENEELLKKLVIESRSYAQLLRKIGLRDSGCNYLTLKRALLKFGIEFIAANEKVISKKMTMEEILVENSTYANTKTLKLRLLKDHYFEYKCYSCNNTKWLGKKIPLQLEHINGCRTDNRLKNLSLLCPNCHAQTETYCGKNKGKYKHFMILKDNRYNELQEKK
jgi:predicted HNH restriction endonuclease